MSEDAPTIFDGPEGGHRPEPTPGSIGPYKVEGRLGAGGMGEVFLAWDERLERRVAIKRIRQGAGLSPEQRERFRREARLAARLSHPNIVQIHDLVSDGPDDAIVMEHVEGRSLADLVQGRLEMPEILRLACEIAEGLAAAHEAGLVHRDLKAANVLVTSSGHAKILDFGLARPVIREQGDPSITRQGIILGTCHAMSPEQAQGEELDERSDLFSFGALVHEMLTGCPPFRGNDPIDSLRKVVTEEPVDPRKTRPDLPEEADHLLRRLLKKNRDERPASAREVIEVLGRLRNAPSGPHAVSAAVGGVGDLASGDTTLLALPAPFRRPSARRLALLSGTAVVLLAVALYLPVWASKLGTGLDVRYGDYMEYKEIQQEIDRGSRVDLELKLERIKDITKSSPNFLEAQILGARIARSVFLAKRDHVDLESAHDFIRKAKKLEPHAPLPLVEELYLLLAEGKLENAENILKTLEELISDGPRLWVLQALVAEKRDDREKAATLLEKAVAESPSWRNQYLLADVYIRLNRLEDARTQIEAILEKYRDNGLAQEKLGDFELQYGDVDRAERIYGNLGRLVPERAWNNLGTVHLLRGNLEKAEYAYNRALDYYHNHAPALINLAEVEWDLGKKAEAKKHFEEARDLFEQLGDANLSLSEHLAKAHCLARLGHIQEAVKIAREQVAKNPEDASLLFQSVLIYSLAGDRSSARKSAKDALEGGFQRRWFKGSAFQWLYEDPEVGPLLREDR